MTPLGELTVIIGGGTPSRADPTLWDGSIPWATVKDFKSRSLGATQEHISARGLSKSASNLIPAGSIIVPTRMAVGKIAINTVDMAINQDLKAFKINDPSIVDRDYLVHVIASQASHLVNRSKGATVKGITLDVLRELQIPLLPLAEQKRIAAILDKADAIRRKREKAIALTDTLLKSVFLDMFGDPVSNPNRWETKTIEDLAMVQIGPFGTQLHKEDYVADGIPIINPKHISNGKIVPDANINVSTLKHALLREYHLEQDDILLGRRGEMGRCAIVNRKENGWMCGTGSLFIRLHQKNNFVRYLAETLSSFSMKKHLEDKCLGATMPNLNKGIVNSIEIPIPNHRVINHYVKLLEIIEKRRALQFVAKDDVNTVLASLTQRAFRGELTSSDLATLNAAE